MSYGKYGMKINVPANQQLPWSTNDPWYNLGGLIGMAWGDNYNRRGEARTIDEMQRVYNNMQNQPNSVSNQPLPQNLSATDSVMSPNLQVPDNIAKQYDMTRAIGTAKVAPDNRAPSTANTTTSSGTTVQQPQRDVAAEKLDAVADKYINAGTDNPDGDKRIIGTMTDAVRNGLATYDLSKLPMTDMNQMRALLVAEARKHGRTDYQIQRALEAVMPDLQSKVNEAKDNKWGQLRSILDQQIQSGQLDNAMVTYAEMGKLLPEKTAALKNKVDRMWEPFNARRKIDLLKDMYKLYDPSLSDQEATNLALYKNIRNPKQQEEYQRALAQYRPSARGGGGVGGGTSKRTITGTSKTGSKPDYWAYGGDGYKLAVKEYDDLSKIPPEERTPKQRAALEYYEKYLEGARRAIPDVDAINQAERQNIRARLAQGESVMNILASYPAGPQRELAHKMILDYAGTSADDSDLIMPYNGDTRTNGYPSGTLNYNGSYGGEDFELNQNATEPPADYSAPSINTDVDVDGAKILSRDALGNPTLTYKPNNGPLSLDYRKVFGF